MSSTDEALVYETCPSCTTQERIVMAWQKEDGTEFFGLACGHAFTPDPA